MDVLTWKPSCAGVLVTIAALVALDNAPRVTRMLVTTQEDAVHHQVKRLAGDAFACWALIHPRGQCPSSVRELSANRGDVVDVWDRELRLDCVAGSPPTVVVTSAGPDGRFGTLDDIRSEPAEH
jgi:hypothetical protein